MRQISFKNDGLKLVVLVLLVGVVFFWPHYSKADQLEPKIIVSKIGQNLNGQVAIELFNRSSEDIDLQNLSVNLFYSGETTPTKNLVYFKKTSIKKFSFFLMGTVESWQLPNNIQSDGLFTITTDKQNLPIQAVTIEGLDQASFSWSGQIEADFNFDDLPKNQLEVLSGKFYFDPLDNTDYEAKTIDQLTLNNSLTQQQFAPEPLIDFSLPGGATVSKVTQLNWQIDAGTLLHFASSLDISQDQSSWANLYNGTGFSYQFNSYNFDNGIYYFRFSVQDKNDSSRKSVAIIPAEIANNVLSANDLKITEICSYPHDGEPEWLELNNSTDSEIATQLTVHDNYSPDILEVDLAAGEYAIVTADGELFKKYWPNFTGKVYTITDGKIGNGLSNSGDLLKIFDPRGNLIDEVDFKSGSKGQVYASLGDSWAWQNNASPGLANTPDPDPPPSPPDAIITEENNISSDSGPIYAEISKLKDLQSFADGSLVQVSGVVTALSGQVGSQVIYLDDGSAGLEIYCYYKDFPNLDIGQQIKVIGSYGASLNRLKITKASDITIVGAQTIDPTPVLSNLAKYFHRLVKISGKITKKTTHSLILDNNLMVYASTSSQLDFNEFAVGMEISAIGIVGESSGLYRVYVRTEDDIEVLAYPVAKTSAKIIPKVKAAESDKATLNTQPDKANKIALETGDNQGSVKGAETAKPNSPIVIFIVLTLAIVATIGIYWWRTLVSLKLKK